MFHFLARIGRKKWARNVVNTAALLIPAFYYGSQNLGLNYMERIFSAQSSTGEEELLSEDLKRLISETFEQIKDNFHQKTGLEALDDIVFGERAIKVRWFCSSTLEPVNFGLTRFKPGVLIGLPIHYNYEKTSELPDEFFKFKCMTLFKRLNSKNDDTLQNRTREAGVSDDVESYNYISRDSDIGREYADSLVLSRAAKKYSIARELYIADSNQKLLNYMVTTACILMSVAIARGVVHKFRLDSSHISQRFGVYITSAAVSYMYHNIIISKINESYEKRVSDRVADRSKEFHLGLKEYTEKLSKRKELLNRIVNKSS